MVTIAYDDAEFRAISTAAEAAGLTPTGFVAETAVAIATGRTPPSDAARAVLGELMAARTQVRKFGVNVNQAVRELNTTGNAPDWLDHAVTVTTAAVERLDELARQVVATIPGARRP